MSGEGTVTRRVRFEEVTETYRHFRLNPPPFPGQERLETDHRTHRQRHCLRISLHRRRHARISRAYLRYAGSLRRERRLVPNCGLRRTPQNRFRDSPSSLVWRLQQSGSAGRQDYRNHSRRGAASPSHFFLIHPLILSTTFPQRIERQTCQGANPRTQATAVTGFYAPPCMARKHQTR